MGLPMMGGSVDVAGNPYGCDLDDHHLSDIHDWTTGGFDCDPW